MFSMLFCSNSANFSDIRLECDGRTDRSTDGQTDKSSYRDARTHLKREKREKRKKTEKNEKRKMKKKRKKKKKTEKKEIR